MSTEKFYNIGKNKLSIFKYVNYFYTTFHILQTITNINIVILIHIIIID